ncbi:MAG: HlyD family secretion protein [candidate division NC10 bacterium]|nr:HlyD family secretion protein [candidate division NC10 bacterium]
MTNKEGLGTGLPPSVPEGKGRQGKRYALILFISLVALVGGFFGYKWLLFRLHYVYTDDARVKGNLVAVGSGSNFPLRIEAMMVDEGSPVEVGQLLARLEKVQVQARWDVARAALESAEKKLEEARISVAHQREKTKAEITQAQAGLEATRSQMSQAEAAWKVVRAEAEEAEARMAQAAIEHKRFEELYRSGAVSAQARDEAKKTYDVERAKRLAAQEKVMAAEAALETARSELKRSEAALVLARTGEDLVRLREAEVKSWESKAKEAGKTLAVEAQHLEETLIRSPVKGIVSKKVADVGEVVQPGQPILIVRDTKETWVEANVEETRVRRVKVGQRVEVEVDAYPGRVFKGEVAVVGAAATSEFALIPAENPAGQFVKVTHRIPVRIAVEDKEDLLKPGMMVEVAIRVRE